MDSPYSPPAIIKSIKFNNPLGSLNIFEGDKFSRRVLREFREKEEFTILREILLEIILPIK